MPFLPCTMGMVVCFCLVLRERDNKPNIFLISPGGTVARFAGQNVHKRLVSEEVYQQKQYELALKKAFLGTDEDLLAGARCDAPCFKDSYISLQIHRIRETPLAALLWQL